VNQRDKRLAIMILGIFLLIPIVYALIAAIIGFIVQQFF
jgi:hypothetical protein